MMHRRFMGGTDAEEAIRAELLSRERLAQHARSIAASAEVGKQFQKTSVGVRVRENARTLTAAYRAIARTAQLGRAITPGAEWLLDNIHVVEDQIAETLTQLPHDGYLRLPTLVQGPRAGYARILDATWHFIAHTDSRFDPALLEEFLSAYQEVQPLAIAELWAVPTALRVLLIENLRRIARRIEWSQDGRRLADIYADRLLAATSAAAGRRVPSPVPDVPPQCEQAFTVQLVQRLQFHRLEYPELLQALGDRLARRDLMRDEAVAREHAAQSAANLTVTHIITGLRAIATLDWRTFFERVSLVHATLSTHPSYRDLDFASRDRCRQATAELATGTGIPEEAVAAQLATLVNAPPPAAVSEFADLAAEPSYYLLSNGRAFFERSLRYRPALGQRARRFFARHATVLYPLAILLATAAIVAVLVGLSLIVGIGRWPLLLLVLCACFPASDVATTLVNGALNRRFVPRYPLRRRLAEVPDEARTFVVVPCLLTSEATIGSLCVQLESHYLSNGKGATHFALLSDWLDSGVERAPIDVALFACARDSIAALNAKYPRAGEPRFHLLHRRRLWNEGEKCFMGWERKRGKLHEFNRLLRGASDTSFLPPEHPLPGDVRFVVTLDADTKLPIGTVNNLVGIAIHPLNRPRLDPVKHRVVAGYAILQPRITATLPRRTERSAFQRLYAGAMGTDPYVAAVSDVYQDVFGQGIYTGKGLYDVDAFEASLAGRVPENAVLSHDLFEGAYAGCALVSDLEFFDEFPSHSEIAAERQHRWTRGDWQLLPWILGLRGKDLPNVARLQMVDNLRRSLVAPGALAALVIAFMVPELSVTLWLGFVFATLALPMLIGRLRGTLSAAFQRPIGYTLQEATRDVVVSVAVGLLALTLLAHSAWLMIDAIIRTLFRLLASRRHLLEWTSASQVKATKTTALRHFVWQLRSSTIVVISVAFLLALFSLRGAAPALPLLTLWWIAPLVAQRLSVPRRSARSRPLSAEDERELRLIARRTWRFFTAHVDASDNDLPPDNLQEDPTPVIAHRSSPTNYGLYLLSIVTARDFGWLGVADMTARLERTLDTLARLERHHGHFLNWYDTQTLRPLPPRYLSTVDSGNLAGHLLVVAQACEEACGEENSGASATLVRRGLLDTLAALERGPAGSAETPHCLELIRELHDTAHTSAGLDDTQWSGLIERAEALLAQPAMSGERAIWARELRAQLASHQRDRAAWRLDDGAELRARLATCAKRTRRLFHEMDFGVLFDRARQLFHIGYNVDDGSLDASHYDLLASEARLASFVAIAKGDVTPSHWARLGRRQTQTRRGPLLVSWSGSMFEYLMPSLVMATPVDSLLDVTCRRAVACQIDYGAARRAPWGTSESAFNVRDLQMTYQYSAFGVPGLGLMRGLASDLVVAPYATALAAMYDGAAAARNFERLRRLHAEGEFGFYEALDFTPERLPPDTPYVPVRAYMAHHQGMSLVALGNALLGNIARRRFHREPLVLAAELLLQEATTRTPVIKHIREQEAPSTHGSTVGTSVFRSFDSPHLSAAATQVLSNGRYSVMATTAGGGYSNHEEMALTRWREDPTRDAYGSFIYLRDLGTGAVWSAGYQPTAREPDSYQVILQEDRVRISREDDQIGTQLEITVSPEDDAEIRRLTLTNRGAETREIEITSYAEVVLAPAAADVAHPAFSSLFVETSYLPEAQALLASRRPRSGREARKYAGHCLALGKSGAGEVQYETDRARFIGRGRSTRAPLALHDARPLSNTTGAVLDPIFSLRTRIVLPAGAERRLAFTTLIASSREGAERLIDKYRDAAAFHRASTLAFTHAQIQLNYLKIEVAEAQIFQALASRALLCDRSARPSGRVIQAMSLSASGLWRLGISGDRPIVLLRLAADEGRQVAVDLLRAQQYWRSKRIAIDVVILNDKGPTYAQHLQSDLESLARAYGGDVEAWGAAFVVRSELVSEAERAQLFAVCRVVLDASQGGLAEQVMRFQPVYRAPPPIAPDEEMESMAPLVPPALELGNGLGGFADEGREYVTVLDGEKTTPAPWCNVIANAEFGFVVSESGGGYAWCGNSRENQLHPWSNDAVTDAQSEALYLRDEESGVIWSPTPGPIRLAGTRYISRHGLGYSRFQHRAHGLETDLTVYAALDAPVKVSRLRIRNLGRKTRRISATAYVEWSLGSNRASGAPFISTEWDRITRAVFARNRWNIDFGNAVAFLDLCGSEVAASGDRAEFLGRHGTLASPAAMLSAKGLSGAMGGGLDPCAALRTEREIEPGDEAIVVVLLGQASSREAARGLIARMRTLDAESGLRQVKEHWREQLESIQIETPDRALDVLANHWLMYQVLSSRYFARCGFYQAGGAYGFRDQLQDSQAFALVAPQLAREQLLRAASRQFVEGDVQHWWHPPSGRGVRTHISDDRIWLAHTAARYLAVTGDRSVLDEPVGFIEGPAPRQDQEDLHYVPAISTRSASLYEHCALALDISLLTGVHGLPLIGGGDWNDGMNRVGHEGKGESVWLAWFLIETINRFAPIAKDRGDTVRETRWRTHAEALRIAAERDAWDGNWYRRAYFDDGTPLGTAAAAECRIDSIAQSWAVISRAASPERATRAMQSVRQYLMRPGDDLLLLLTPPFDVAPMDPGYIKGYVPGVRENGGQYTHASIWSAIAYSMLGDNDMAYEIVRMLNPASRSATSAGMQAYRVEPYAAAADIYSEPPHARRGGWTWYTGSAGWLYRAVLENVMGIEIRGDFLAINPRLPGDWPRCTARLRRGAAVYNILIERISAPPGLTAELDGAPLSAERIPFLDDGAPHSVRIGFSAH